MKDMKAWPVQDADAHFSELLAACMSEGPQVVTTEGAETAVLIPFSEWKQLKEVTQPSLKDLLLTDFARGDLVLPARGDAHCQPTTDL